MAVRPKSAGSLSQRIYLALRPMTAVLPPLWRVRLRAWLGSWPRLTGNPDYDRRAGQELSRFAAEEDVNDLPEIFHYWAGKYLRAEFETFGFSYPEDFFAVEIARQRTRLDRPVRVVSIGAGNCDREVVVAKLLRERGVTDVTFECVDLTPAMLERGRALASTEGLADSFTFTRADLNDWHPHGPCEVVLANQSLHHVVGLESLLDAVSRAIGTDGVFVTSDMIGRNGHQRWPEARAIVQEFWRELPRRHRYNVQLRRRENEFLDWDCSVEGFEGVRAQDILPLLVERFGFRFFLAYGNVIDPFVDRGFGPNFDAEAEWDRDFIDRVHARDEAELHAGRISPTHVLAVMTNSRDDVPVVRGNLTPAFCVRRVE